MAIDSELIGQTTMSLLDKMESDSKVDGGKIIAVGILCVVENVEGDATFTRVFFSDDIYYQQIGLLHTGIEVLETGLEREDDDED